MIRSSTLRNLILPILIIASLLLASCGQPAPAPQPSAPTSQAEAVVATDTPVAQPVKPTAAPTAPTVPPTPTVEPLDLPPVAGRHVAAARGGAAAGRAGGDHLRPGHGRRQHNCGLRHRAGGRQATCRGRPQLTCLDA